MNRLNKIDENLNLYCFNGIEFKYDNREKIIRDGEEVDNCWFEWFLSDTNRTIGFTFKKEKAMKLNNDIVTDTRDPECIKIISFDRFNQLDIDVNGDNSYFGSMLELKVIDQDGIEKVLYCIICPSYVEKKEKNFDLKDFKHHFEQSKLKHRILKNIRLEDEMNTTDCESHIKCKCDLMGCSYFCDWKCQLTDSEEDCVFEKPKGWKENNCRTSARYHYKCCPRRLRHIMNHETIMTKWRGERLNTEEEQMEWESIKDE